MSCPRSGRAAVLAALGVVLIASPAGAQRRLPTELGGHRLGMSRAAALADAPAVQCDSADVRLRCDLQRAEAFHSLAFYHDTLSTITVTRALPAAVGTTPRELWEQRWRAQVVPLLGEPDSVGTGITPGGERLRAWWTDGITWALASGAIVQTSQGRYAVLAISIQCHPPVGAGPVDLRNCR